MSHDDRIFLTHTQAIKAICNDFHQYDPQLMLFSEIIPIISDGARHLKRDPDRNGAWINTGSLGKMRWLTGADLVAQTSKALNDTPLSIETVAAVCARVFQTRVEVGVHLGANKRGVFIDTGMAHFNCRQCGRCCRALDYHSEVTAEDVKRWRSMGRQDILDWVEIYNTDGQTTYRIWVKPGSGQLASRCPFLRHHASENRWSCSIHTIKPAICRDYPVSRKHAHMTGCNGFKK